MALTPEEEKIIKKFVREYGIDLKHPEKYDITNPEVARRVNREIAEAMYPIVKCGMKF